MPEAIDNQAAMPAAHFKTQGEHRFNLRVYRTLGWFTNAALSVVAVLFAERTPKGREMMTGLGNLFERGLAWTKIKPETLRYLAEKSFYLTGGFAVMVPMKLLEDKKSDMVKRWNREIYGEHEVSTNPDIIRSEAELEAAPKQTWRSILSARVLALVPFYITVGALWDRGSVLSRMTNAEMRTMGKEAAQAMEKTNPQAFSQLAAKGWFIERPLTWITRNIGRAAAWVAGNSEAKANIEQLQKTSPAKMLEGATKEVRDPMHSALPHYVLSETITSGMVAAGVYLISRVTGPLFGQTRMQRAQEISAAEPAAAMFRARAHTQSQNQTQPYSTIATDGLAHEAPERELERAVG